MTEKPKIDILVVDDSAFMRLLISDILSEDPSLNVVGSAIDGKEAAEKNLLLKPSVVLLDMEMGEYDGLYAVQEIMRTRPVPIIILSSVGNTHLETIFEALKAGAVDYINKPKRSSSKMRLMNEELINKIKSVINARPKANRKSQVELKPRKKANKSKGYEIVAIGASTGGPSAIEEVITSLPDQMPVPVLICQHMPESFIQPFVNRLNGLTNLQVVMGRENMPLKAGEIIIAPGHANMIVKTDASTGKTLIDFDFNKYSDYNNPSINALFTSVATIYQERAMAIILTGMGKDGVEGMRKIKIAGGLTAAQNKATAVIYGMPKVALETGAASHELDIKEVGEFIVNHL